MKKLLSLLTLLISTMGAVAIDWRSADWAINTQQYQDRLVVKAQLEITNLTGTDFTIGAFIGDECRSVVTKTNTQGTDYYLIQVYGNDSDIGKTVTFRLFDQSMSRMTYGLTPSKEIKFAYDTEGNSNGLITLSLIAPTSVTIGDFEVEAGKSVDLMDYLTLSPQNAQWPLDGPTLTLKSEDNAPEASIEGTTLTAGQQTGKRTLNVTIGEGNMPITASKDFNIVKYATSITLLATQFEVEKDNESKLQNFMPTSYQVSPDGTTDIISWEIEAPTIIVEGESGYLPIKAGTTRIRPYVNRGSADKNLYPNGWITVTVFVPVESIKLDPEWWRGSTTEGDFSLSYSSIKCNVGDDISYITDKLVILPEEASNKEYTISEIIGQGGSALLTINNGKITANAAGQTTLKIESKKYSDYCPPTFITVIIDNPAKQLTATTPKLVLSTNYTVDGANSAIAGNIAWGPEGTSITLGTITGTGVVQGSGAITPNGVIYTIDSSITELSSGTGTVTAQTTYYDYSNWNGSEDSKTDVPVSATFDVQVTTALSGFDIAITRNASDPSAGGTIKLTPKPEDAVYDGTKISVSIQSPNFYDDWADIYTLTKVDNLNYTYTSNLPGEYSAVVLYDHEPAGSNSFTVPAKVELASGWQWKSNPFGEVSVNALSTFFGSSLIEARTREDLYYNDTNWGYYGSLTKLPQAQMYKVKMNGSQNSYLTEGEPAEDNSISLQPGWNWVGSPYFYNRSLGNVFIYDLPVGTLVVSKSDGSAELNASKQWQGDLQYIKKGEGYLIYNPTSEPVSSSMACEIYGNMAQGNEDASGARSMRSSVWSYDHSRFANNMTMVVEMPELRHMEDYTIGAFVDGECRGEGSFEDGYGFVTVHCNSGEQVSFQLHNELTGEYYDIDQTVKSQTRIGSLKAPYKMTSMQNTVTGIGTVNNSAGTSQHYDLNGRQLNSQRKGVNIQRMPNGTVRKVVVR